MSSFKEVNISNPGTSIKFGGNDLDTVTKLMNGVAAGIPAVRFKSQNKVGFWDGIGYFRNQADSRNTTIRGQSNVPTTDLDLTLPPIVANDVLVALGITNVFPVKQEFDAGILLKAMTMPGLPGSGLYYVVVDAADGHLKKKNNAGTIVDYDAVAGGGEVNTITNVGAAGVGVYKTKVGVDLKLKKINAGSSSVTITDDTSNDEVDIDVVDATTSLKGKVELATSGESSAGVVVQGNDARLSDARTPATHAASHKTGGSDPIKIDEFASATDVTLLNATTSAHGLLKKLSNSASQYMDGTGNWSVPAGAGGEPDASTTVKGIVELATDGEVAALLAVQANDTRLSNARTPSAHATSHKSGGSDVIKLDEFGATTDITTLNSSTTAHGLLRKLSNVATQFLDGQGNWTVPATSSPGAPDVSGVVYVAADGTGDYTTLSAALTAQGANKVYMLSPGDHAVSAQLVSTLNNITINGSGIGVTRLLFTSATGTGAAFVFNGAIGSAIDISANAAKNAHALTVSSGHGVVAGDWIYMTRDVQVQNAGNNGQDGEIHQVLSTASTTITLVDQIYEAYTTAANSNCYKITWMKNLELKNLTVYDNRSSVSAITEQSDTLFSFCYNLRVVNVLFEHMFYAACTLQNCFNSRLQGVYVDDPKMLSSAPNYINYGIVILCASTNVNIDGGWANSCRHSITTDILAGNTDDYGRPRNIVISNFVSYNANNSHFDSHEGAVGIVYNNCGAVGGYHTNGLGLGQSTDNVKGFNVRSPTAFNGCWAENTEGYGWTISNDNDDTAGDDTKIGGSVTSLNGCRISNVRPDVNGTARGIRIYGRKSISIVGCEFFNIPDEVIVINDGCANIIFDNNIVHSCGSTLSNPTGLIRCLGNVDDLLVRGNIFGAGTPSADGTPLNVVTSVDRLVFKDNDVNGLTNKIPSIPAISTVVVIKDNPGLNPLNQITDHTNNTTHTLGSYGGVAAAVMASATDYTVVGGDFYVTVLGGTVSEIRIKDGAGNTVSSGLPIPLHAQFIPNGYKLRITYSVAPTITLFAY